MCLRACPLAGFALALLLTGIAAGQQAQPEFTDAERAAIVRQGPWPMDWKPDPSNRVSGNTDAASLGFRLFFDARLSRDGVMSCATCHRPERGFSEDLAVSEGRTTLTRNAPGLLNVRHNKWFGRDGGTDSLWASSIRTFMKKEEFDSGPDHVIALLRSDGELRRQFEVTFGPGSADADGEAVMVMLAKALAAFQETLTSERTVFDEFRDALAAGDDAAAARYPAAAARGARLFFGRGGCQSCHFGPMFSNGEFGETGLSLFLPGGGVDKGRYDGVRLVKGSRFNLLGPYNDDPSRSTADKVRYLALKPRNWGEFAVPSLRNVSQTSPYMHDGSLATLSDVVRHYNAIDPDRLHANGSTLLQPLGLGERDVADLVAFLETL